MGMFPDLGFWQLVLITLVMTHITIAGVTIFLHRAQAHRAVTLGIVPSHFFRFWLWITTGMVTREWVAIHRKHHARCETEEDPHSPLVKGLSRVLWGGALLYREEAQNAETIEKYGRGTPDDWLERNVYSKHPGWGISLMLVIDLLLFGLPGLAVWLIQMAWIPFWAAGVINGLGHFWGYRSWSTEDASTNLFPIAILIGGEELHNNHHAFASSARLSSKWYEFDIGWMYIRLLEILHMAKVRKVAPRLKVEASKLSIDMETLSAVVGNRLQVLANYRQQVVRQVLRQEREHIPQVGSEPTRKLAHLISTRRPMDEQAKARLQCLLSESQTLETVYQYQQNLQEIWDRKFSEQSARLEAIQEWINNAEKTGITALERFAHSLRGYSVA